MPAGHIYTLKVETAIATAITALQLEAGATTPFEILSVMVTQDSSIVSAAAIVALRRKSVGATVTAASIGGATGEIFKHREGDPNPDLQLATDGTGFTATVEGTETDEPWFKGFNVLNGVDKVWLPDERIFVEAAGIIGLKFTTAPATHDWQMAITIKELG